MSYGILKTSTNIGVDSELVAKFTAPLQVVSNQPVFTSDTASLRQVVSSQRVQRWEIEAHLEQTNNSANYLVHSTVTGYEGTVYIRMPQVYRPEKEKSPSGLALTVASNVAKGASVVPFNSTSPLRLQVGEFINVTPDPKVYLVTSNNGTTITVFPALRMAATSGAPIKYGYETTLRARHDSSNVLGITYTDGVLSDPGSVKFKEQL